MESKYCLMSETGKVIILAAIALMFTACLSKKEKESIYRKDEKAQIFSKPDKEFVKGFLGNKTCLSVKELGQLRTPADSNRTFSFHPLIKPKYASCIGLYDYEVWRTNNRMDCPKVTYKFLKFEDKIVKCTDDTSANRVVADQFLSIYGNQFTVDQQKSLSDQFCSCKSYHGLFLNN